MEPESQRAFVDLTLPLPAPHYRAHTHIALAPVRVPQTFVRLLNAHPRQLHYVPREPQTFSTEKATISEPPVNTYWILIVDNFQ